MVCLYNLWTFVCVTPVPNAADLDVFQYRAKDLVVPPGKAIKAEIVLTPEGGQPEKTEVFVFKDGGVLMGMYNTDEVIL